MKLYSFQIGNYKTIGAASDGKLVDFKALYKSNATKIKSGKAGLLQNMLAFINAGDKSIALANELILLSTKTKKGKTIYGFDEVKILPPVIPGKILCAGVNYKGHFTENPNAKMPSRPFFFSKFPSAVVGHGDAIIKPAITNTLDYEVEFAAVFGATATHVSEADALDYIFGYTILHDVSAREVQFADNQITLGKNFDTFSPIGPCIVTKDEIKNPAKLKLKTTVNKTVRQNSSTADWIYPLPYLISSLTEVLTMQAGDIMTTGTPAGVALFTEGNPYLQTGDTVTLEIEKIGKLSNTVIEKK